MKIYRIPLAEYIACVANIAFLKKYIAFGVAEYICFALRGEVAAHECDDDSEGIFAYSVFKQTIFNIIDSQPRIFV